MESLANGHPICGALCHDDATLENLYKDFISKTIERVKMKFLKLIKF